MLNDSNMVSWWQYRLDLIWSLDVDDLFRANSAVSKRLYNTVQKGLKSNFLLEDANKMIRECPGLSLTDKEMNLAIAYSNFPVVDEMTDLAGILALGFQEF